MACVTIEQRASLKMATAGGVKVVRVRMTATSAVRVKVRSLVLAVFFEVCGVCITYSDRKETSSPCGSGEVDDLLRCSRF